MAELSDFAYLLDEYPPPQPKAPYLRAVGSATAPEGAPDAATIVAALRTLSPTMPEPQWWQVVVAVRSALPGQEGFDLVDDWSSQAREDAGQTTSLRTAPGIWKRVDDAAIDWTHLFRKAIDEAGWKPHRGFNLVARTAPDPGTPAEEAERARNAAEAEAYPPLARAELPLWLGQVVDHLAPLARAWPHDWCEMLAVSSLSALFPNVFFENLGVNLWFLGLAKQELGKSTTMTEVRKVTQGLAVALGLTMGYVSQATLEGYGKILKGDRTVIYAEHHEYAAMLQILARDYNSGIKGLLCALYDGEDYSYHRSKDSVEFTQPYMTVCAATHHKTLVAAMPVSDLYNGYASRFLFCAPPHRSTSRRGFRPPAERARLVAALGEHLRPLVHADLAAGWAIPPHSPFHLPPAIAAYQAYLGLGEEEGDEWHELEETLEEEETPATPGRCLARVKKMATLFELLSATPQVTAGVVTISDHHAALAVRLVERGAMYGRRMAERIGEPADAALAARVLRLLKKRSWQAGRTHGVAAGLTRRQLGMTLKVSAKELDPALYMLEQDGSVREMPSGKTVYFVWAGHKPRDID